MSRKLTLILPALGAVALLGGLAVTTLQAQTPTPTPTMAATPVTSPAVMAKGAQHKDPAARFASKDTNKDGFIDKSEATGALMQRFDEIDTNHDGKISLDEMQAAWKDRMVAHGVKPRPKGEHPLMGGGAHLARLDTNKDGKVSWEEMSAATKAHFDQLDTNHDGFIDASEMPKGPKIGHKHHKQAPGDMLPPATDTPAPVK